MKNRILLTAITFLAPTMLNTSVFADTSSNQNNATTDVTATFTAPTNPTNPTPPGEVSPVQPGKPETPNPGNKPLNPQSNFGIAYVPKSFNFGSNAISNGSLSVTASPASGKSFDVGVKNETHTTNGWTLSASLKGDLAKYNSTITTKTQENNVKLNNGTNSMTNVPTSAVTSVGNYQISSTSANTPIMTGVKGQIYSGTFNLNLGDSVTLNIPDTTNLAAGDITGTIDWNLATVPSN